MYTDCVRREGNSLSPQEGGQSITIRRAAASAHRIASVRPANFVQETYLIEFSLDTTIFFNM